jgi:hypothetical protein
MQNSRSVCSNQLSKSRLIERINFATPASLLASSERAGKADRENHERITDDILLDAAENARAQIKQKSLDSLTPHQRVVYDIVREHGPVGPSEPQEHARTMNQFGTKGRCRGRTFDFQSPDQDQ